MSETTKVATVFVCSDCGRVLETRELGLHDRRGGQVGERCSGPLLGPRYLVDADGYLDTLLAGGSKHPPDVPRSRSKALGARSGGD
jgi:hypothetical protein